MKAIRKQFTLATLLIGLLFIQSCKGPEGDAGPAGVGTPGADGPAGPAGPAGSANVFYSSWIAAGPWSKGDNNFPSRSFITLTAPRITADILDKGVVMVYARLPLGDNYIRPLPATIKSQFTEELLDFSFQVGTLKIFSTPFDGNVQPTSTYEFRYVVVPGGQAVRMNTEKLTYEEAKIAFDIKD